MKIKNINRYSPLAVGLKPPAMQGEARLRGRERTISSKTISPRLCKAKPACAGESGIITQSLSALGQERRSPPARATPDKTSSVLIRRIRADQCSIPPYGSLRQPDATVPGIAVVLPTPPFCMANARTWVIGSPIARKRPLMGNGKVHMGRRLMGCSLAGRKADMTGVPRPCRLFLTAWPVHAHPCADAGCGGDRQFSANHCGALVHADQSE